MFHEIHVALYIIGKLGQEHAIYLDAFPVEKNRVWDPESKVHGANMGPTWVLSAPEGPHVDPMNLAIREIIFLKWQPFS